MCDVSQTDIPAAVHVPCAEKLLKPPQGTYRATQRATSKPLGLRADTLRLDEFH
ncbi:MAG TPA: hypothetical protein P5081_17600 [Phycisphaerae bacterium]|nr:hypothetical protein [Phycisphaerae bacterium]